MSDTGGHRRRDTLARLLEAEGLSLGAVALQELVAGVAAAPRGRDPDAWIALVAPNASQTLRAELGSLRERLETERVAALQAGPAPRERLAELRAELSRRHLDGFIVPRTDEHQGEYVPARAERLRWLTGFSGSAGTAVVTREKAAIFIDGRYTLQVRTQVDTEVFEPFNSAETPPPDWIHRNWVASWRMGYDPWLHSAAQRDRYKAAVEKVGGVLEPVTDNPVDRVWRTQPPPPLAPIVPHDVAFAGKSSSDKRAEVGAVLVEAGVDAAVLTMPDSIAWILNVRGGDVPHTPLPLSFAIVHASGDVEWFVDPRKLAPGLGAHLGNGISISPIEAFPEALEACKGKAVLADPQTAAAFIFDRLEAGGAKVLRGDDPCAIPKACKNAVELAGTRAAHRRDGVALVRFLAWFAEEAQKGTLSELGAAERLQAFRYKSDLARDLSFGTISGSGPNGAIVHYSVSAETDRPIGLGELYLVDSGGQYLDGTTDVTRTVAVGTPTAEMRDRFTRVLRGHIALATAVFPDGTTGSQLDAFARRPLWEAGLDFDHGTGHGVGSYLSVHEGPQRISKIGNNVALKPGMIVSNEPGYYKTGAYGIRIENLVAVVRLEDREGAERPMLGFETLTRAPIDLALVEPQAMSESELEWLNEYHRRVREEIGPHLDEVALRWLEKATRPVGRLDAVA